MDDITVEQYFSLADRQEYDAILKHLKPVNSFAGGKINLNKLTYKSVKNCLHYIQAGKTVDQLKALFATAYNIEPYKFYGAPVKEFFAAQNNIMTTFINLQFRESKLLSSITMDTHLWEMAGGQKLNKFSNIMPLIQLGEIYHIWPYDLENRPYNQILTLLVAHKEKAEVNREFNKLKSKHNPNG